MKKILLNRTFQKCLLPASCVLLLPLWIMLKKGISPIPLIVRIMGIAAAVIFVLYVQFKPWQMEKAEQKQKEAEELEAKRRALSGRE